MLEQRVARLEEILVRREPRIVEIALTGAKQSDLQAMRIDVAEIKGRLTGLEDRFGSLPTTWQMVSIIATMLVGIAGIVFVAGSYFSP